MKFFAPCAKGLEYLLVDELRALGIDDAREGLAGVGFSGTLEQAQRGVLWSRLASRILVQLGEFACDDEAALYAGLMAIDWSAQLAAHGSLWIDAHGSSGSLVHTQFVAQRAKDAIVDQFRQRSGQRPDVDRAQPDVRIDLLLRKGRAVVSIDLAGPLHRRGWRSEQGDAPLKETLAAAVLIRGGWPAMAKEDDAVLLDPMCGAGTLLIEGALMAADVAPGLQRHADAVPTRWLGWDAQRWQSLCAEAVRRAEAGRAGLRAQFFGYDIDARAVAQAEANARRAGMADWIRVTQADIAALPVQVAARGLVVCNPPYDERLAADPRLYRTLGRRLAEVAPGWRAAILCGDKALAQATGLRAGKTYSVFNGALACTLIVVDPLHSERPARAAPLLSEGAQMVANRLRKNRDKLARWRQREGVSCYRVYDADLPEYAAAIDVYQTVEPDAKVYLHVQEYQAPKSIPEEDARRRLGDLVRAAEEVFALPREQVALKTRQRGKGGSKYGVLARSEQRLVVEESALKFEVNLFDYLDTGLFLDHRPVRALLRTEARGRHFLNLFCYTATASVYAASGGAASTTSVDLSATYLEWAGRNLGLNGLRGADHRLVQADVMTWLAAERARYGLIFCDPPTFSNSARAEDFDVQRDHVDLIERCMDLLSPGGLLVFSTNARRFRLDPVVEATCQCDFLGERALPMDFARNPRIHRAWRITRR